MKKDSERTLTAGSVHRRWTWDEMISPEEYAARMYPNGVPRRAPLIREGGRHRDYVDEFTLNIKTVDWYDEIHAYETECELTRNRAIVSYSCADFSLQGAESRQLAGYYSNQPLTAQAAIRYEAERYKKWRAQQVRLYDKFVNNRNKWLNRLKRSIRKQNAILAELDRKVAEVQSPSWPTWFGLISSSKRRALLEPKVLADKEKVLRRYADKRLHFADVIAHLTERLDEVLTRTFTVAKYKPRWYDFTTRKFLVPVCEISSQPKTAMLPVRDVSFKTTPTAMRLHFSLKTHGGVRLTRSLELKGAPVFLSGATASLGSYPTKRMWRVKDIHSSETRHEDEIPWDSNYGYRTQLPAPVTGQTSLPAYDEEKFQHALNRLLPSGVKTYVDVPYFVAQFNKVTTMLPQLKQFISKFWDHGKVLLGDDSELLRELSSILGSDKAEALSARALTARGKETLSLLRTLSCADLYRKFSVLTTLRSLSDMRRLLDGTSPFFDAAEKLLDEVGTPLRRSSTFDESVKVNTVDVPIGDLLSRWVSATEPAESRGTFNLLAQTFPNCGFTLTEQEVTRYRVTVIFKYVLTDTLGNEVAADEAFRKASLDALGLYLTPRLMWDLVPYSFAFDWLYSVRSILEQVTLFKHLKAVPKVAACMVSRKSVFTATLTPKQLEGEYHHVPQPWEPPVWTDAHFSLSGGRAVARRVTYDRWLLDPLDVGRKFEWPALRTWGEVSSWAKLTGLELLAQRF